MKKIVIKIKTCIIRKVHCIPLGIIYCNNKIVHHPLETCDAPLKPIFKKQLQVLQKMTSPSNLACFQKQIVDLVDTKITS